MPRKRLVQTSGVVATRKAAALPQGDPDAIAARFKDFPNIDVLTRRFTDPNDPGSLPILLKEEDPNCCVNSDHMNRLRPGATKCHLCKRPARIWYVRWFNLGQEGRNSQMRVKGYEVVKRAQLRDDGDVADMYSDRSEKDVYVRRGDRGQEVLGYMPLEAYNQIKSRQRAAWNKTAFSAKKTREQIAQNAGNELGDEAGQSIHDGDIQIESMRQTRTTLGDEAGQTDADA